MSFGLPILLYIFTFACNDISGCPAPSLLSPKTLDLETLKREVGWPEDGVWGLVSWEVTGWVFAYYLFSAVLHRVLPGTEVEGTVLPNGGRLKYKFNSALDPAGLDQAYFVNCDEVLTYPNFVQLSLQPSSPWPYALPAPSPKAPSFRSGLS